MIRWYRPLAIAVAYGTRQFPTWHTLASTSADGVVTHCGGRWPREVTESDVECEIATDPAEKCVVCADAVRTEARQRFADFAASLPELPCSVLATSTPPKPWTGPDDRDMAPDGLTLRWSVHGHRWPFGPPGHHEDCCNLRPQSGRPGGLYCDCKASDASDRTHGETSHCAPIERGLSELRSAPAISTLTTREHGVMSGAWDVSDEGGK